jgi:hypothetical protein
MTAECCEAPPDTGILSEREIFNGLSRCLVDRPRRAPIACVARAAGVSRMSVYRIIHSRVASTVMRVALSPVLQAFGDGTLAFRRIGQKWEQAEYPPPAYDPLAWQDKAVRFEDWNSGRCRSCGSHRYTLVTMGNRLWYLCDHCRPWQTDGTGARPVEARRKPLGPPCDPRTQGP